MSNCNILYRGGGAVLTTLCHLTDIPSLLVGHEAQDREDDKASVEAGETVHTRDDGTITEINNRKISLVSL